MLNGIVNGGFETGDYCGWSTQANYTACNPHGLRGNKWYRTTMDITALAGTTQVLRFDFGGMPVNGYVVWELDNVAIATRPVPEPWTVALLAGSLGILWTRRRLRK